MRRGIQACGRWSALLSLLLLLLAAPQARAAFGFQSLASTFTAEGHSGPLPAGSHPEAWSTSLVFNTTGPPGAEIPDGMLKDLRVHLPPGAIGTPALLPRCPRIAFYAEACAPAARVGSIEADAETVAGSSFPLFNLSPQTGEAAALGAMLVGVPVIVELQIARQAPYGLLASISNVSQAAYLYGARLRVEGTSAEAPFLTLPRSCAEAPTLFEADRWNQAGAWVIASAPDPLRLIGCNQLPYSPELSARPTTLAAAAPSGLDLDLDAPLAGYRSPTALAEADTATALLRLPPQMTLNPPLAAGLEACTPAQLAAELPDPDPAGGCPQASKLGTATVMTPLFGAPISGALYAAQPDDPASTAPGAENPFDSRFALYLLLRDPQRGVLLSLPIRLDADPSDGRLSARIPQIPALPIGHLALRFNDGPRAPLSTPAPCGAHAISYSLTPSSGNSPLTGADTFTTEANCPTSFAPGLSAGTISNSAGSSSPFILDLRSAATEPDLAAIELTLPPGLGAAFATAGICPEDDAPRASCPPDSRLGFARIALGTGPDPLWIPAAGEGQSAVYLAGPYRGAPYSLLIHLRAKAGPFDLGDVVLRAALEIDPRSAQATVRLADIPQILAGVPLRYRRIRLLLDRPGFIRNPTSCEPYLIRATATSSDGQIASLAERFQAADCAALPFRPKLSLRFSGALARNGHPTLRALLRSRPGEAGLATVAFTLPRGELLDLHRLRALCDRALIPPECPAASRLGYARLWSPLLAAPLQGPIYLRSPGDRLPDLLGDLRSDRLHILLEGTTAAPRGLLQFRFTDLPDLPLSKAVISMPGGPRGIFANSEALCARPRHAQVALTAQNGKLRRLRPAAEAAC